MSRFSLTLLCILTLSVGACDRAATESAQENEASGTDTVASGVIDRSQAGELMPVVNLVDLEGAELNTGALQGRPVLLNLWATWCPPCIKEMPLLDELAEDYGDALKVLTVSQDLQGAERVEPFWVERDFERLEPWLDTENELSKALSDVMPTTVLYDASGQEVWRVLGDYDWSSAEARGAIDEALAM
ncbi:TlpA family protein disulfide reductase [Qipengyuania sp. DGS5-3]|uniref:TlpA family protein disulfide reductase n=1 Tax=Qipengyuania sp. DGS5-3 TaxID=3349632 RepID=UPI0036D2EDA6